MPLPISAFASHGADAVDARAALLASLFGASEKGVFYDPSDLSTMWQDAARTTAVTAKDQPVRVIDDVSGNGNHATASSDAKRPMLRESGGVWYLETDGIDDAMSTASAQHFGATDKITFSIAVNRPDNAALRILLEYSPNANNNTGSFYLAVPGTSSGDMWFTRHGSGDGGIRKSTTVTPTGKKVITGQFDFAGTTHATEVPVMRQNAVDVGGTGTGADDTGTGDFGTHALYLFSRNDGNFWFKDQFYGLVMREGLLSGAEIDSVEDYLATKAGVTL